MWKLEKPQSSAENAFETCISSISDADLKNRLVSITGAIVQAAEEFDLAATANLLHTIEAADNVGGVVTKKEMSSVYSHRMARKGAPGRQLYDDLLAAPKHGRCPLCGQHTVSTLDHHLPKANYPALAVAPWNLVPACADCNKSKTNAAPHVAEDETLHPYYDDIEGDLWLIAQVVETVPVALKFYVLAPDNWSNTLGARVRRHFEMLHLARLYASKAAQEITDLRDLLKNHFEIGGIVDVRTLLQRQANSCRQANLNGWRTATYDALADSDWYCNGGFAHA